MMIKSGYQEGLYYNEDLRFSTLEMEDMIRLLLSENHGVGIIGGYFEKGLPICLVSELTLQMLGYVSGSEFENATKGLLSRLICNFELYSKDSASLPDVTELHLFAKTGELRVRMISHVYTTASGQRLWLASLCDMNALYEQEQRYDHMEAEKRRRELAYQAELEKQKDELEKALQRAELNNEIISAISKIYWMIYRLDLENGTFRKVTAGKEPHRPTGETGITAERFPAACRATVALEYQKLMLDFLNTETLAARLTGREEISREYQTVSGNWHMGRFIVQKRNKEGVPTRVLYTIQIINGQKKQELRYQQELLMAANEAERSSIAKTDFLRRMSHDIRTPINAIRGMIEISNHFPTDTAKLQDCRDKMLSASDFLLELVNNVLDMNKLESGKVRLENKPFDITDILRDVNSILEMDAKERGITFLAPKPDIQHCHLTGSPLHLQQIIQNIGSNALKYNRPGGSVTISAEELHFNAGSATFRFVCEDTGIGMSAEFQKHAFEPFSQENATARTSYSGTGLGLAIVRELVCLMGGTIRLKSKLGEGTRFEITLTFSIDNSYIKKEEEITDSSISLAGRRVLLVEDNELNMEIAEFIVERDGMEVVKAWNGAEAVELFRRSEPGYFDFILMDVMMPVMDGIAATKAIRSLERPDARRVPIFAMTANAFMDDVEKSIAAGMNEHLSKPLNFELLTNTFRRYLAREANRIAKSGKSG